MKRLIAMATLVGSPALASAAGTEVTLYGVIDLGIQVLHSNGDGGSHVGMQSGNAIPSQFGLRGREDLGDGYAAIFRLEQGINVASGSQAVPGKSFNRYAYVGVESPSGTVTLGRQFSLMHQLSLLYDATLLAQFSAMSANLIPVQTINPDNSIKYVSPDLGGARAYAMYSFGEQDFDDKQAGRYMGAGLEYRHAGFSVRGVYEQTRGASATSGGTSASGLADHRYSIAAAYRGEKMRYYAGWAGIRGDLELSPRGNLYWLGLGYQTDGPLSLIAQVMHYATRDDAGSPNWYILGGTYSLSKRTSLYTYAGYYDNRGASGFALNTYDFSSPSGRNQSGLQLGITHIF